MRKARLGRPAVLLVLMAIVAYTYWIPRGALANSDTRVALTRAIVDDHSLSIDRYAAGLADRSAYRGHYYTDKAPGVSLLAVPVYAVLRVALPRAFFTPALFFLVRYLLTCAVVGLPAAIFAALLWRFLLPILGRRRAALLTLGYALGTMAWALSALMFSHVLAAMSVFGAVMLLYPASMARGSVSWTRFGASGLLCGLAVCFEYPAGIVAATVALLAAVAAYHSGLGRSWPALVAFGVGSLIGAAPVALMNLAVYGNALSQGYAHLHGAAQFRAGMGRGVEGVALPDLAALWGITFSPYRGLFVLSPFLLLAIPGLAAMWRSRRQRPAALVCATSASAMLLFNSSYFFWDGGVSLGPRHVTPALPFLVFPVAFAMRRQLWRRAAPWLIALSIGIVGLCCVSVLIFLPGVPNPIVDLGLRYLLHGPTQNNWGMLLGLRDNWSLLPFFVLEAVLSLALWRSLNRPHTSAVTHNGIKQTRRAA